jgi:hypothetical protein
LINPNFPTGSSIMPMNLVNLDSESDVKLNEDQYEVYVNENFVGYKTLKNQGEDLTDIDDFLRNQKLNDFSSSVEGDHYKIQSNEQANDITNALSVYFTNR